MNETNENNEFTKKYSEPVFIKIPLSNKAHKWAQKFASYRGSIEQKKQIYLSTLAVYAVYTYLNWIQIDTDLENSDSWNLAMNPFFNVCDLELPNTGKLICCPVLPGETRITPPELLQDSIAYVLVRFKEVLDEVEILAFRPIIDDSDLPETISIDIQNTDKIDYGPDLFPIENLLSWLFYIQDIKKTIEESLLVEDSSLVERIRRKLEEQIVSSSQFAVKSLHFSTKRESMFNRKGKELLSFDRGNNVAEAQGRNKNSSQNIEKIENEDDRELEQLGGDWLRLVKQITSK